jgi:polar amino acid transport system substrate-binding protein
MRYMFALTVIGSLVYATNGYSQPIFKVSTTIDAARHASAIVDLRAAYQLLGIELEIIPLPAKRALLEAEKGNTYDAELARIEQAEKLLTNFVRIPVSLREIGTVAVASKDLKALSSQLGVESLSNYRVASMRGILITDFLLKDIDNILVDTPKQGLYMLLYKRIDVFVALDFMVSDLPNELKQNNFIIHRPPIYKTKFYHYLHKKHKGLAPALTQALSQIVGKPIELP